MTVRLRCGVVANATLFCCEALVDAALSYCVGNTLLCCCQVLLGGQSVVTSSSAGNSGEATTSSAAQVAALHNLRAQLQQLQGQQQQQQHVSQVRSGRNHAKHSFFAKQSGFNLERSLVPFAELVRSVHRDAEFCSHSHYIFLNISWVKCTNLSERL